jgi:hypothetical protein
VVPGGEDAVSEVVGLVAGSGFASGVNLYATVLLVGLYGRWLDGGVVPDVLMSTEVLVIAGVLTVIEFLADKVPWFDSVWDAVHTVLRPAGAAALAVVLVDGDTAAISDAMAGGTAGLLALTSHAAKASTRVAINTSPEPFSNTIVSVFEDGLVAAVVWLAVAYPYVALGVVAVLTVLALAIVVGLWRTVRAVRARMRQQPLRERMREVRR